MERVGATEGQLVPDLSITQIVPRRRFVTEYMQRPPLIMPNYGKRKTQLALPKTNISRVLLYDNITQQQMLDVKLANIKIEKDRAAKLLELHKRSFRTRIDKKHQRMREAGNRYGTRLPEVQRMVPASRLSQTHSKFSFHYEDIRLPKLEHNKKYVLFRVKDKAGQSKIYHTLDEEGIFLDFVPLHTFYPTVVDDPRFQCLEDALARSRSNLTKAGFAKLSPSYVKEYPKFPDHLMERQEDSAGDN